MTGFYTKYNTGLKWFNILDKEMGQGIQEWTK